MDTLSDRSTAHGPARHPSRALAATLSFFVPGLGQAYRGRPWLGIALALPFFLLLMAVGFGLGGGGSTLARILLSPGVLTGLVVLNVGLLAWRIAAIGHAGLSGPERRRAGTVALVALLIAATVATHLWTGIVVATADRTLTAMFGREPHGSLGHLDNQAVSYGWNGTDRINFLLLGYDSAPGRAEELTDTMMVVSVDPVSRSAVMISIPRDTGYVPLPDRRIFADGRYPAKLNELASVANANPSLWCPDLAVGADCGTQTLSGAIGLYLGISIQHVAWIDLLGFASLIDALGGVDVCLPGRLVDPTYGGPTWDPQRGIVLEAGCHHYDGVYALAYSRSRKGWIEMPDGSIVWQNDYQRAARQQEVLLSLESKVTPANLLVDLPRLMEAIGATVTTDFPRAQAGDLAALATLIDRSKVQRLVLGAPDYVDPPVDPERYYMVIPRRDDIRAAMAQIFGVGQPLVGWYLGSTAERPTN